MVIKEGFDDDFEIVARPWSDGYTRILVAYSPSC
jgi:hypothetical protein